MTESKWTAGPWRIDEYHQVVSLTYLVGTVNLYDHPGVNGPANARLIAAAPDLAEAARPLVERLNKYEADFPDVELEGLWLRVSATDLRALRAALIKAGAQ